MSRKVIASFLLLLGVVVSSCEKGHVDTEVFSERIPENVGTNVVARVDAVVLAEPKIEADSVGTVQKGDLLTLLAQKGEFSKVTVRPTNTSGWIYTDLCMTIPQSPYWEGDTEKAREMAKKVYQDKFMVERNEKMSFGFPSRKS